MGKVLSRVLNRLGFGWAEGLAIDGGFMAGVGRKVRYLSSRWEDYFSMVRGWRMLQVR